MAVGESANKTRGYEWSIVSGGPPSVPTLKGKCRTGDFFEGPLAGMKGDGLWIFTRNPIDPASAAAAVETAQALGFDVRELKPVTQRGCLYGAAPTPAPPAPPARAAVPPAAAPAPKAAGRAAPSPAKAESGRQQPPAAPLPRVTRRVFFDLAQGGNNLGRVVLGL